MYKDLIISTIGYVGSRLSSETTKRPINIED